MEDKMFLPISIVVSALVLAGTLFVVAGDISNNVLNLANAVENVNITAGSANTGNNDAGNTVPTDTGNTQPAAPTINMEELSDEDKVKGDADAPVTIVEFSDFQCPFCGNFYNKTLGLIEDEYVKTGKVKIIFRDFPLSFHPEAQPAAEAAECASEQGKFWEFHDKVFSSQATMGAASYKQWAADLGLNTKQFNDCVDSNKYRSEVLADFADGQAAGVSGTPTFFINGQKIVGAQPFSVFKQVIDAELAN